MNEEGSMDQLFLEKVHEAIEKNLANENFGVDELACEIGISRSQLHRRLKLLTGHSASQMIRDLRLKKAFELLQHKAGTVSEISYQVGFGSPSHFNTCFKEYFGYPPGKVKRIRSSGSAKKFLISRKILFISLASLVVVASVFIIFVMVSKRNIDANDKSIAVLPFKSMSYNLDNQYLADGVMDAILLHLSKIEDLRVVDRTSVEQYRETDKTTLIIGQELNVAYLLEGSFQKYGDQVRLIVQLIRPGKEGHIWAKEYDRNWHDIFAVQSEVAQTIARELQAVITPEERQIIEKIPTINLTAYDFYQRGREEYIKYEGPVDNREVLERAEDLFKKALEYDSTYAQAYTGLGWVYEKKHFWVTYLTENFLDSMLILADIALSFDDQLADAYVLRGDYYRYNNDREQAIKEYDKAIKFNPNDWQAYWHTGSMYVTDDFIKIIDNYQKAVLLHRGPLLPKIYRSLGAAYGSTGFKETYMYYAEEALKLDDDSVCYYSSLGGIEESYGNFEKAIEFYEKALAIDSTRWWISFRLGMTHAYLGHFKEYLEYVKKYELRYKTHEGTNPNWIFWIGHAYWVNGFKEEAVHYFDAGLEYYNELLELHRHFLQDKYIFYNLAAYYAFLGDRDKAFENLRLFNQSQRFPFFEIKDLKNDPLFESIRDEPEFQQILRDVESKCQAEPERVRWWLEEQGML
jgi:TolB-like protein/AraC-like DNA-binding protein